MTPENFVYWLQGFFEITGGAPALNEAQTKMVKEHLEYVFQSGLFQSIPASAPQTPSPHLDLYRDILKRPPDTQTRVIC